MVRRIMWTLVFAAFSFMLGLILAFFSTPLLSKLEQPLHLELAGHSGPSDWILWFAGLSAALMGGLCAYRFTRR